jgi:ATP-dependent Lhr-like helicase
MIGSELQRLEMRGAIRRGYFVEGLSGMQFALPAAVEELRRIRAESVRDEPPILINACDPANPFGGGVGLQFIEVQPSRISSNYIAFLRGRPVLLIESNGARIHTVGEPSDEVIQSVLRTFLEMVRARSPQPSKQQQATDRKSIE